MMVCFIYTVAVVFQQQGPWFIIHPLGRIATICHIWSDQSINRIYSIQRVEIAAGWHISEHTRMARGWHKIGHAGRREMRVVWYSQCDRSN